MRTTSFRAGAMVGGGLRGSRSNELLVIQPAPTFGYVLAVNVLRILGCLLAWTVRHPRTLAAFIVVWLLFHVAGMTSLGIAAVALLAGLVGWRWVHKPSWYRLVVSRWRAALVYRRCWQPAMVTCGLATEVNGREYLPRMRKVISTACVDQVLVDLLSGQSPADFETSTVQLTHTFEALRCRVMVDRPGRVWLEFTHTDPLRDTLLALDPERKPDLAALPVGRRADGEPWRIGLLGSHLLVAGATGAGKGSVVWSLIRALGPAIRDRSVQVWAIDPKGGMELTPAPGCSPGSPMPIRSPWSVSWRTRWCSCANAPNAFALPEPACTPRARTIRWW